MRARAIAACIGAALYFATPSAHAALASPVLPALAPDSSQQAGPTALDIGRSLYANAWAHRQAGDYATCAELAEKGLQEVALGLASRPDMGTRVSLTELQAKLGGLRDASRRDQQSAANAKARGNEADEKVLNAPADDNIELQVNRDVLRWVEHFTGAGRSTFERWLKRSGRYVDLFRAALQKEGMPSDLAQLVFVESGFNVHAKSRSAAVGPWQFLRSTGKLFGLTVNQWVDERRDPEKSTVAAARYLKHLYSIFGDWPLALASYNAGEGTVLRAIKAQGTTNYWDLRLPREAEEYVPQYMAVLAISRDPKAYGFDGVALDDPIAFDEVAFKGAIDLRALARLAECSVEDLKHLNPAVLSTSVRGPDGVTSLRVPRGKGEMLMKKLKEGEKLPAVDLTIKHRVRRGETLQRIANRYQVSAQRLALANNIGKKRPLRTGTVLTVPASLSSPPLAIFEPDDPRHSTAYVPPRRVGRIKSLGAVSNAEGRLTVTVKRGETLAMIAQRYGVTVADVKRWNRLQTGVAKTGTRLKIRTEATVAESQAAAADSAKIAQMRVPAGKKKSLRAGGARSGHRVVVVRRGDTLSEIAKRHGVSVAQLRQANRMRTSTVRAGQRLKLPTG